MTSPVDIVNQALDEIAAKATISGINPASPPNSLAAQVASRQYQPRIDALSRSAHWNCLRFQASLTLLKARQGTPENPSGTSLPVPPTPWLYEYGWPQSPFCLRARYVVPVLDGPTVSPPIFTGIGSTMPVLIANYAVPFAVASDLDQNNKQVRVILTNAESAQLVYTARVEDPDLWDSQFTEAAISYLAAWFVNPIAKSKELLAERVAVAKDMVVAARISDGNEGPSSVDHIPDFIAVRGAGGLQFGRFNMMGWDGLALPGGGFV